MNTSISIRVTNYVRCDISYTSSINPVLQRVFLPVRLLFFCTEVNRVASVKRDPLIKISVVSSARDIEAVVWRRRDIVMSDQDVDDVAFLTGRPKKNLICKL